jgi:primosomal protein N'
MARIVCRDTALSKAEKAAEALAQALRAGASAINSDFKGPAPGAARPAAARKVRVDGPQPCTIARISEHHRIEVVVIAPDAGVLRRLLTPLREQGLLLADTHTAIDVDPLVLL